MNVGHLTLPESYLKAKLFNTNVDLDTNIFSGKRAKDCVVRQKLIMEILKWIWILKSMSLNLMIC